MTDTAGPKIRVTSGGRRRARDRRHQRAQDQAGAVRRLGKAHMRRIEAERAQRQRCPDREQGEEGEVPEHRAEADAAQQLMVHHETRAGLDGGDEGGPLCTRRRRGGFRQSENAGQGQGGAAGGQGVAPGRRQELGEQAGHEGRRQAHDRARQLEACIGARQVGRRHQAGQQRDRCQHIDHGSRGADEGGDAQQAHDAGGGRRPRRRSRPPGQGPAPRSAGCAASCGRPRRRPAARAAARLHFGRRPAGRARPVRRPEPGSRSAAGLRAPVGRRRGSRRRRRAGR